VYGTVNTIKRREEEKKRKGREAQAGMPWWKEAGHLGTKHGIYSIEHIFPGPPTLRRASGLLARDFGQPQTGDLRYGEKLQNGTCAARRR